MTIGDVCEFKTNFPEADFWIQRKGDEKNVGKPTKEYNPENIGVKVIATELVVPSFLFYYFQYLHSNGIFVNMAHGTLNLKNIRISEIKQIPISFK